MVEPATGSAVLAGVLDYDFNATSDKLNSAVRKIFTFKSTCGTHVCPLPEK